MKLRLALTALCVSGAAISAALNAFEMDVLRDWGFGSRGRHIESVGPHRAVAVGDVNNDAGVMNAAAWPDVTSAGGGPRIDLPTPGSHLPSTAASYTRLSNGDGIVVGQVTDPFGMRQATTWRIDKSTPLLITAQQLPQLPNSTGSEALDVIALGTGDVLVVGSDWPAGRWLASIWMISPTGQTQQIMLPQPEGTGWSIAHSVGLDASQPGLLTIVGKIQESPNGPWRACMWRFDPSTGHARFRPMASGGRFESYGYRIDPLGRYSVGWFENNGEEYGAVWQMRQGFPQSRFELQSRFYGVNSRGYLAGRQIEPGNFKGLISHVSYVEQQAFSFKDLLVNGLTHDNDFYLDCIALHGQTTGSGMSRDYEGGPTVRHAIVGIPTGDHGFDTIDMRHGFSWGMTQTALLHDDGQAGQVRAQNHRIVLDGSILSAPLESGPRELTITLALSGTEMVEGSVQVFNFDSGKYEGAGTPLHFSAANPSRSLPWATFPSSWRSASGEIRFRLSFRTNGNNTILPMEQISFN